MFEQKCIRHWREGGGQTIQLCKHAATSFPPVLQACTETSHCLNSTHSIPVPGPRPAAASSLQACLPEQRQIQALQLQGSSTTTQRPFYTHAKMDSSPRNASESCASHLITGCHIPFWPPTEHRLGKTITSLKGSFLKLNYMISSVMTKLEIYLYWYLKYAKRGRQ